ncbi:MAG: GIY-YIG nuclease family protein [Bacteroidota bacterium]
MGFFVYILISAEGHRYIGHTSDITRRLYEHNSGLCHSTKHGHNWEVVHLEKFSSRAEAMNREKWLKSGIGRSWLQANIAGWSPPKAE